METRSPSIVCAGLVLADMLMSGLSKLPSHWEQTIVADNAAFGVGGGAANSAVTAGILGGNVRLVGCVGRDDFGTLLRKRLEDSGVDCGGLRQVADLPTGIAAGLVKHDGQRCFITMRGANLAIGREDFERIDPGGVDVLHINGFFQFPQLEPMLPDILARFHAAGAKISLDTASWDASERWFEALRPFAGQLDYLFLNKQQILKMSGEQTVDAGANMLLSHGVGQVIAKLGEKGCVRYKTGLEPLHTPARQLPVVDTTGAGDSFDAAYLLAALSDWNDRDCARFANTVAGLNCCKTGATAGVPELARALEQMRVFYQE